MNKSKRKKTDKLPKPIKVKKEKTEEDRTPQSMAHYVQDRLELVKQIFGSLKPKTITNLAPDFLKSKSMGHIQELCLDELLGVSTKRLLSIINATQCPSDTDSSSDSDVQHKEEHISLEEISSDSEIEGSATHKVRRRGAAGVAGAKKDAKTNAAAKGGNPGQMSVLELLELQARARAIRSQLALEPVTKIEVDSDEAQEGATSSAKDNGNAKAAAKLKRPARQSRDRGKSPASTASSSAATNPARKRNGAEMTELPPAPPSDKETREATPGKRIKLKRNYRSAKEREEGSDEEVAETTAAKKDVRTSRSQSPDVVPIVAEPETLLISDSSDVEPDAAKTKEAAKGKGTPAAAAAAPKKPEKRIESEEEGELADTDEERESEKPATPIDEKKDEAGVEQKDASKKATEKEAPKDDAGKEGGAAKEQIEGPAKESEGGTKSAAAEEKEGDKGAKDTAAAPPKEDAPAVQEAPVKDAAPAVEEAPTAAPAESVDLMPSFEQDDEDVISLEGGDLESEMTEHLAEDVKPPINIAATRAGRSSKAPEADADVISLDSSGDEKVKNTSESWRARYLRSSKVSKVLAESRLGKRVRDKIKKSKRSRKDSTKRDDASTSGAGQGASSADGATAEKFVSQHEDGSVEQYKELLELRQRKS